MKSRFAWLIVSLIMMSLNGHLKAQMVTDRPDQTESSSTVGFGNLQLETGLLMGFEGDDLYSTRQILAPTTLFRYGITENIEIRLLSQFEALKTGAQKVQGISDLEIGAKIQIFQREDSRTEVAFITHLLTPTGTRELSGGNFGTINKVAVSHTLNESLGLGYNMGYNYPGAGKGNLTYSLVLGVGINEKVGLYAEPFGEVLDMEEFLLNFDAGLTFLAWENLQFDFSFGTGINHRMNYIALGFCWKVWKDQ